MPNLNGEGDVLDGNTKISECRFFLNLSVDRINAMTHDGGKSEVIGLREITGNVVCKSVCPIGTALVLRTKTFDLSFMFTDSRGGIKALGGLTER